MIAVTDVLVCDVADEDLARIDEQAAHTELSRGEYLRRQIAREAACNTGHVSVDDLQRAGRFSRDLLDEDVLGDAWS